MKRFGIEVDKLIAAQILRPANAVPAQGCFFVVMKWGNARGAKGAGHRHWHGSTGNGRNPMFNGRRQPSRDGTSRMNREVQVRICEGLGVQFPGPTRQNEKPRFSALCQLPPAADVTLK